MSTPPDAATDVVELCVILQCLGFNVKSLDTSDTNISQEGGTRTVVINCQSSGLHVILESEDVTCSCPANSNQQNSGFWQVSGVAGGKQSNKECGSSLLGSLPKARRERLTKELQEMVRFIKEVNDSDVEKVKDVEISNRSASMIELKTPDKKLTSLKTDTPKRYRSLDTLTTAKETTETFLAPGPLQKQTTTDAPDATGSKVQQSLFQRQSTYTLSSTPSSTKRGNKTSSPIQAPQSSSILENLIAAERTAEDLKNKLSSVIREFTEEGKNDSSMSSLVLDVSKISILKGAENSKLQFASSPNLSGLVATQEDLSNRLKRGESASTSNLTTSKNGKTSKLRRISPNIFRLKKDSPSLSKLQKAQSEDTKSTKMSSLLKLKTVTPGRASKPLTEASPNLSASRKKFSHVKSTIPRPTVKKE